MQGTTGFRVTQDSLGHEDHPDTMAAMGPGEMQVDGECLVSQPNPDVLVLTERRDRKVNLSSLQWMGRASGAVLVLQVSLVPRVKPVPLGTLVEEVPQESKGNGDLLDRRVFKDRRGTTQSASRA